MNEEFAFVTVDGGQKVARFREGRYQELLSLEAFMNLVRNRRAGGARVGGGIGKAWIEHPERRTYEGLTFEPGQQDCGSALNTWRGFAFEPEPGDVEPF